MKKILKLSTLIIIAFLLVINCKKDDGDAPLITISSGKISASSDTASYDFTISESFRNNYAKDSTRIKIQGEASNGEVLVYLDFQNMYKLKSGSYKTGLNLKTKQYIAVYISVGGKTYGSCDDGDVTITTYNEDIMQGNFKITLESFEDSTKTFKLKGQFNCSFTGFDPSIKDIDIVPGSMEARVNDQLFFFNVIAADITMDSTRMINITATRDEASIVLQFINFQPWSGKTYKTGMLYNKGEGYIKASYIKNSNIPYMSNENDTLAATIKVAKISATTIQGYFEFDAVSKTDTAKIRVRSGKFNARFKDYE